MAGISAIAGITNRNGSADHTTGRRRALAGSPSVISFSIFGDGERSTGYSGLFIVVES
jgi:hypothetical protein